MRKSKKLCLPELIRKDDPQPPHKPVHSRERPGAFPCPCCGCRTLPVPKEEAIAYICPVCFWENDLFTASDEMPSDCNHSLTLEQGRANYRAFGACERAMLLHVRPPRKDELP